MEPRIMNARNFRREFPTLNEPVTVISKERILGTWTPRATLGMRVMGIPLSDANAMELVGEIGAGAVGDLMAGKPMTQPQRDAILRKINRGHATPPTR